MNSEEKDIYFAKVTFRNGKEKSIETIYGRRGTVIKEGSQYFIYIQTDEYGRDIIKDGVQQVRLIDPRVIIEEQFYRIGDSKKTVVNKELDN